jgi:hypothetical protein
MTPVDYQPGPRWSAIARIVYLLALTREVAETSSIGTYSTQGRGPSRTEPRYPDKSSKWQREITSTVVPASAPQLDHAAKYRQRLLGASA